MSNLVLSDVSYQYQKDGELVVKSVNLSIAQGEMVAITGPSGSGKSTLFYLLGGLLAPTTGHVSVMGHDLYKMSDQARAAVRNQNIGFVFQKFHLLPRISALRNILLPSVYCAGDRIAMARNAEALALELSLTDRMDHNPNQLSGGQQQRVAIARALLFNPEIILCDEPTGNLDSKNAADVMTILRRLHQKGKTIVIITHDEGIASQCDRKITIRDGTVASDSGAVVACTTKVPSEEAERSFIKSKLTWRQYIAPGIDNIKRNKVKSFLTMVGVSVGTASLVAVIALGEFAKTRILDGYQALGVNRIEVSIWPRRMTDDKVERKNFKGLTWAGDLLPLKEIFPEIRFMSPMAHGWFDKVTFGGMTKQDNSYHLFGVNEQYKAMSGFSLQSGRWLSAVDERDQRRSCVLGAKIAKDLKPPGVESLVGHRVGLFRSDRWTFCQVVGELRSVHGSDQWNTPDSFIFAAVRFAQTLDYFPELSTFSLAADRVDHVEPLMIAVRNFFEGKYGHAVDIYVNNDAKLLAQMNRFIGLFSMLLISLACVSMLVGGVGIYNMMAVSVSERLREIGLRKAVGASQRAIRQMVLFESALLCSLAGIIGVVVGFLGCGAVMYLISQIMTKVQFEWLFNPWSILVAMTACIITGVVSGLVPAQRAERMEIIQALSVE